MTVPTVAPHWEIVVGLTEVNTRTFVPNERVVRFRLVQRREQGLIVFGERVFTAFVYIDVVDVEVCHWFGGISKECFYKGMGGTQR